MKKIFIALFLLFALQPAQAQKSFDELSLQEKIGQTIFVSADINNYERLKPYITKGLIGGVLIQWGNYSREETKKLTGTLQSWAKQSPNKIPLLIAIDYEGGTVYSPTTLGLPFLLSNMVIAAANDYENTQTIFYIIAQELKNLGIHINFAPVMDVNTNPQNPIIGVRSFGGNKDTVSAMGKAIIEGLQQGGIISVAKHFPGHGDADMDTHKGLTEFKGTQKDFNEIHLYPFKQAIETGVKGIMTSHIRYPFIDNKLATYSPKILQNLLRKELGFKGLIFTDSLDMKGALISNISKAAYLALNAGADVVLIAKEDPQKAINLIKEKVPAKRIEEAAQKVYEAKKELNLFNNAAVNTEIPVNKAFEVFARKITQEAVTLVKNEDNLIPYKNNGEKNKLCAVFFAPSRLANQLPYFVQPFLNKGFEVNYYNAPLTPKQKDINRAKDCVLNADIAVIGTLQWANKGVPAQKKATEELLNLNGNTVILSLMSPYDLKHYPNARTVLAIYGVNSFSATAAAEIILGNIKPKGQLPINF